MSRLSLTRDMSKDNNVKLERNAKYFSQDEKLGAHKKDSMHHYVIQNRKNKIKNPPAAGCKSNESTKKQSFSKVKISF